MKRPPIKMLALGEGPSRGRALKFAENLLKKRVAGEVTAVDFQKPEYKPPGNMTYVQENVLRHLETMPSESVKAVTDDFFIHHVPYGKEVKSLEDIRIKGRPTFEDVRRTLPEYIGNVKRILIPGGKFLLTTFAHRYVNEQIVPALRRAGFTVTTREYKTNEIYASGSKYAKEKHESGIKLVKIIAQKPK